MTSHGTTIELAGIGAGMDDRMLMNMYRTYGPIVRVTHNGSNSAQVVFAQENHANQAVEATNGAVVYGKTLKVRLQRPFAKVNKPCRGFAAGICRQGEMCKYQHVTDTAQHPPKTPSTVQKVKREKKKKAPKTAPEPAVVPPEIQAIPGLPKPAEEASTEKTNRPCLFFQSGVCTRGDACRFVHEPKPSATPVAAAVKKAKAPAKKTAAPISSIDDESEAESGQNDESRTCVECEKPGVAVWKCGKCDNSLYCNDCNSAVHSARVMAKHKRAKLPSVPKLPRCGECESKSASVQCKQCEVAFCSSCDASVHKFKSLRKHSRVKLSAKSEKAKPQIKEEPKPAKKAQEKKKRAEEVASLPKVADHVAYVESVPKLTFSESESSDSEDEEMAEASPVQSRASTGDDDEPMPAAASSSDTETDDDFDDVKPRSAASASVTPTLVVKEEASESEEDFDDKPTPASVPKTELSSDSESSDDEVPEPTPVSKSAPKTELSSDSDSEDDSEDEALPASKPAPVQAIKPSLAELSSESDDDSDDEVPSKPAVKSTSKSASKPAMKVSSESSDDSDDEAASKPAVKKTPTKSSSSDSSSSDSSDSEDEAPSAKPTPAPRRAPAPAPVRNNKAGGISEGSSHTLVKKIEAFNESGEGNELHLDANLNGFERLLAHDCAERLGLAHESVGAGLERHIIISRHGSKRSLADSSSGHKAKKSKHHH